MELAEFVSRLDDRLDTDAYSDIDASANGLQVGPDEKPLDHAAFAVDAATATISAAADAGADVLVTHHGLSWGGIERVTDRHYDRIAALVDNDIALYVTHLPLDGHQTLGNAAALADCLGLDDTEPFGTMGPEAVGQQGTAPASLTRNEMTATLEAELEDDDVQVLDFGPEDIEQVAIVTGSGTDWLDEAREVGADTLITGEGKQQVYHRAREAGVNVVLAGHYATETGGVQRLQALAEEWGLSTSYHSHPTGL
ncbi:Nif3-like dinuclear metal center hexameric protein [Halonotius terrestris]|uniref:Nif3-like dinuclear metal center hexameric protein n=1 Tax=Halonotius terrestris TaxID=2487750 RepID=A0A8J8PBB9_9EURY|nr:Nif3-like dinuclear metal center hexameric protein [Halonotius terrestris]TQQ80928.1 Nif3-like dinuclear metal center hexameric protein [Halonotius terrestris]